MYYEIIIFVIVISLFILFIRKKEKFQCPVNIDPSPNIDPSVCKVTKSLTYIEITWEEDFNSLTEDDRNTLTTNIRNYLIGIGLNPENYLNTI